MNIKNSKHQITNNKQIPMTQIQNSKHLIRQHLCKWHNQRRTKVWAAIRYNCGECFGHWNLPFDLAQGGELVEPFEI